MKPIKWEIDLYLYDKDIFKSLIIYLTEKEIYEFQVYVNARDEDDNECFNVEIQGYWTNNLKSLSKWLSKNVIEY